MTWRDAPDYRTPCIKAAEVAASGEYRLVETLARPSDRVTSEWFKQDGPTGRGFENTIHAIAAASITSATVAVHKPLALVGFL